MSLKPFLVSLAAASVIASGVQAQDIPEFEGEVDRTIRSACHGFMVDALPDAVSWLRDAIYEGSPFCRRVLGAGDLEAFGDAVQDAYAQLGPGDVRLDLTQERDRDLNVTIECDSEYMCMEMRLKLQETETPISQQDYDVVSAYCDGRYGCIQAYFENWPAPLPTPMPIERAEMTRFSQVIPPAALASLSTIPEAAPTPAPESPAAAEPGGAARPVQQEDPPALASEPAQAASALPASAQPEPGADAARAQRIKALNTSLRRSCQCSLSGQPCFDNPYGPVRSQIQAVEDQRLRQCRAWDRLAAESGGVASHASDAVDRLESIQSAVTSADERGAQIIRLSAADFQRIRERVALGLPFVADPEFDRTVNELAMAPPSASLRQTAAASGGGQETETAGAAEEALFIMGPRQVWSEATAFCERLGRRLPSVAEGRTLHEKIPETDWWFGMWTSDVSYQDAYVQRIRTVRPGGAPATENGRSWQALTVCVE
ncbi:MAG: hypothetical protein NXI21_09745 [Alphaproteobacteria bacterium]|nr:hypothetical protein [Alphaproteobacteria bacterium]